MAETVQQGTQTTVETQGQAPAGAQTQTQAQGVARTFTQAELDAIVGDRLSRERAKYADYETLRDKAGKYDAQLEAGKTELQRAQDTAARYKTELDQLKAANAARDARDKIAAETGVPASLLTADTEDACRAQAQAILAWRGQQPGYPALRDAGEVNHNDSGTLSTWAGVSRQLRPN